MSADKLAPNITCFYYPDERLFRTEEGNVITSIHPLLVRSDQLFTFRHHKKSMSFLNRQFGIRVNLLYPIAGETAL